MAANTTTELFEIKSEADLAALDQSIDKLGETSETLEDVGKSSKEASDGADAAGGGFGRLIGVVTSLTGVMAGLAGALAIGSTLLAGVGEVNAWNEAMSLMEARTGATGEQLSEFRNIGQEIFTSGWGEDANDIADSLSNVKNITQTNGEELQSLTQKALILRDVWGYEVTESTRAAHTAATAFGEDTGRMFDLITVAAQQTGDPMADLLDTVNEYGPLFAQAGYTAEMMFQALIQGSDNGAFNLDKVADAVKEFQIRTLEGSDEVRGAWDQLFNMNPEGFVFMDYEKGIRTTIDSSNELFAAIQAGEIPVSIVGDRMAEMLAGIEDPMLRAQLGTALMGTAYEDLGDSAIAALDIADEGLAGVEGATDRAGAAIQQGLGPAIERLRRTGITLLANFLTPYIVAISDRAVPAMERFGEWLQSDGVAYLAQFGESLGSVISFLMLLASVILDKLGGSEAILGTAAEAFAVLVPLIEAAVGVLADLSPESIMLIAAALLFMAGPAIIAGLMAMGTAMMAMAASAMATAVAFAPLLIAIALVAAYESNFGGLRDAIDSVGVAIREGDLEGAIKGIANALLAIPMGIAEELGKIAGIDVSGGLSAWSDIADKLGIIAENANLIPGAVDGAQESVTGVDVSGGLSSWTGVANQLGIIAENAGLIPALIDNVQAKFTGVDISEGLGAWEGVATNFGLIIDNAENIPKAVLGMIEQLAGVEIPEPIANLVGKFQSMEWSLTAIPVFIAGVVAAIATFVTNPNLDTLKTTIEAILSKLIDAPKQIDGFKAALANVQVPAWINQLRSDLESLLSTIQSAMNVLGSGNPLSQGINAFGDALGFNAGGGVVGAGELTWVGERGPELVRMPATARIFGNHQIGGLLGGAGGGGSSGELKLTLPISLQMDGEIIYETVQEIHHRRTP